MIKIFIIAMLVGAALWWGLGTLTDRSCESEPGINRVDQAIEYNLKH